jgi:peptide-methionine (R)-S-oxide reductase
MQASDSAPDDGAQEHDPLRRRTLLLVAAALGGLAIKLMPEASSAPAALSAKSTVVIEMFSAAGRSQGSTRVAKTVKSEAQWRAQLSAESFIVTRQQGTERAYSGATWNLHADGLYRCICCDTALFDSRTKYESGTGWPSFWQPISRHNVTQSTDTILGFSRDAISCTRCDAHLGHVFDDGPPPTGLRYCMNSASLHFVARA